MVELTNDSLATAAACLRAGDADGALRRLRLGARSAYRFLAALAPKAVTAAAAFASAARAPGAAMASANHRPRAAGQLVDGSGEAVGRARAGAFLLLRVAADVRVYALGGQVRYRPGGIALALDATFDAVAEGCGRRAQVTLRHLVAATAREYEKPGTLIGRDELGSQHNSLLGGARNGDGPA